MKNHLKIQKGALLLPDSSEGVLSPWAITGYDRTTYFRLRIPTSYIYTLFHRSPSSIALLEKKETLDLETHFSSREYGLIDTLLIYGIFFQEKLIGALLISDSPILSWESRVLGLLFTVIDELSASLLYAFRAERQEKLMARVFFDLQTFQNALPNEMKDQALLFTLDPHPIVQTFKVDNPEIDTFFIIRDIASILSTILHGAPVLILSEKSALYVLHTDTQTDRELLVHQLESALKHLFPELSSLPELGIQATIVRLPLSL
ncbi:MAG: hypothetical protein N2442_07465 [Spirochaetes bacterium]|nr:hypothetical protein [Spirochaetota bacterium]